MPSWKKLISSGSNAHLNQITASTFLADDYLQVGSTVDTTHAIHATGHIGLSGTLHLGSGQGINWAHGDASIAEGQGSSYSIGFSTYDGSSNSEAMLIEGNNDVYFRKDIISTTANAKISGSTTSTGSFGVLGVGTTGGSNGYGLHIKSTGLSTYPLYIEASDGSNLGGMYEGASGNAAFYTRDASGTVITSLGASSISTTVDIISSKANGVISGSATSTGSFGKLMATSGNGPNIEIFNAGTRYQYMHQNALYFENAYGVVGTISTTDFRLLTNSTIGMVMAGSGQHVTFPVANQKISGSSTSTGSFGTLYTSAGANVGIGTTNPQARLHLYTGDDYSQDFKISNDDVTMRMYASSAGVFQFLQTTNNDMLFGTNSTERMRIISTGNVGIGTASPTTTLDVSGSLRSYSTTIQSKPATSMSINFTQANNFFIDLKHDSALSASHDSICVGQSGVVSVRQDGTGGHDLTLPSSWKTPRGASITWNDNPDDMNLISYYIVSSSFVAINYMGDFS